MLNQDNKILLTNDGYKIINFDLGKMISLGSMQVYLTKEICSTINFYNIYRSRKRQTFIIDIINNGGKRKKRIEIETYTNNDGYQVTKDLDWTSEHAGLTAILRKNEISFRSKTTIHIPRLMLALVQNVKGLEAHHKDFCRNNNELKNIELMYRKEHQQIHKKHKDSHFYNRLESDIKSKQDFNRPNYSVLDKDLYNKNIIKSYGSTLNIGDNLAGNAFSQMQRILNNDVDMVGNDDFIEESLENTNLPTYRSMEQKCQESYWNKYKDDVEEFNSIDSDDDGEIIELNKKDTQIGNLKEYKNNKIKEYHEKYSKVPQSIRESHLNLGLVNLKNLEAKTLEDLNNTIPDNKRGVLELLTHSFRMIAYSDMDNNQESVNFYLDTLIKNSNLLNSKHPELVDMESLELKAIEIIRKQIRNQLSS